MEAQEGETHDDQRDRGYFVVKMLYEATISIQLSLEQGFNNKESVALKGKGRFWEARCGLGRRLLDVSRTGNLLLVQGCFSWTCCQEVDGFLD